MSRPIDLIPAKCRDVLNRRLMVRRWTLVYVLTATALFGTHWFMSLANRARARERDSLAVKVKINWSRSEIVNRLLEEISTIESSMARFNRLAWPIRATEVVDAVASSTPTAVALTALSVTPREEKPAPTGGRKRESKQAEPPPPPRTLMVIEIEGIAPDDAAIAALVAGLDANPLFTGVRLDYTRDREADGMHARGFRVTSEIDLSHRYLFVDAAEDAE